MNKILLFIVDCNKCEINTWILNQGSIPFINFIILLSCLVAYTPIVNVRDKYEDLQPALLYNVSKLNYENSNCEINCNYKYDFSKK